MASRPHFAIGHAPGHMAITDARDARTWSREPAPTLDHHRRVTPGEWSAADERVDVWPGRNWPLGATWGEESTNFAVHAPDATAMWVCLFDDVDGTARPGTR